MPDPTHAFRFDVAFSFAGPHREKVRAVAKLVAAQVGEKRVFFDEWYEHEILGDDMDVLLQRFYRDQSLFVVADLSDEYADRKWCQAEARAIRDLRLALDSARDETKRLRLLNARFGSGNVPGNFETTAYLDGINKSAEECADVILKRLALLRERLAHGQPVDPANNPFAPDWPEQPPALRWPMADHTEARAAFEKLLMRTPPWRFLPLRGPSEVGKSHITRQMLGNVLHMPDVACGRFDFKGTTGLDAELQAFAQPLDVPPPSAEFRLNERLGRILETLKQRARPTVLVFDTYEAVGQEAQDWVEKQLLPSLIRARWLRVVIAGQRVPERSGAIWEEIASPVVVLKPPTPADWFDYGKPHAADLTLAEVEMYCRRAQHKAGLLSQLLGPSP